MFTDYPNGMTKAAQKALDYLEQYGRKIVQAGTSVGWNRAKQLASKKPLSNEDVKDMYSFFRRHDGNQKINPKFKEQPYRDNGYVSWLLWGGDDGAKWSANAVKQLDEAAYATVGNTVGMGHVMLPNGNELGSGDRMVLKYIDDFDDDELFEYSYNENIYDYIKRHKQTFFNQYEGDISDIEYVNNIRFIFDNGTVITLKFGDDMYSINNFVNMSPYSKKEYVKTNITSTDDISYEHIDSIVSLLSKFFTVNKIV